MENELVERLDMEHDIERQCNPLEILARAVIEDGPSAVLGWISPEARQRFIQVGVPLDNLVALRKWARKTWTDFLRVSSEINFLGKISTASEKVKPEELPDYTGVMSYVVSKPRQDVGLTGRDGGAIEVRELSDEDIENRIDEFLRQGSAVVAPGGTGEAEE